MVGCAMNVVIATRVRNLRLFSIVDFSRKSSTELMPSSKRLVSMPRAFSSIASDKPTVLGEGSRSSLCVIKILVKHHRTRDLQIADLIRFSNRLIIAGDTKRKAWYTYTQRYEFSPTRNVVYRAFEVVD